MKNQQWNALRSFALQINLCDNVRKIAYVICRERHVRQWFQMRAFCKMQDSECPPVASSSSTCWGPSSSSWNLSHWRWKQRFPECICFYISFFKWQRGRRLLPGVFSSPSHSYLSITYLLLSLPSITHACVCMQAHKHTHTHTHTRIHKLLRSHFTSRLVLGEGLLGQC